MSKQAIFAKFTPKAGKRDEVVAALAPMFDQVGSEAGTEVYAMHIGPDDSVWFYELYSDGDALKAHGGSDALKAAFAATADICEGRPDIVMGSPQQAKGLAV